MLRSVLLALVVLAPSALAVVAPPAPPVAPPPVAAPCATDEAGLGCLEWARRLRIDEPKSTLGREVAVAGSLVAIAASVQPSQSFDGVDLRVQSLADGTETWRLRDSARSSGRLAFAGEDVLLHLTRVGDGAVLEAREAATGALLWATPFQDEAAVKIPVALRVADGVAFVALVARPTTAESSVLVFAIDAATGGVLWSFAPAAHVSENLQALELVDGLLVASVYPLVGGGPTIIHAIDRATGSLLWKSEFTFQGVGFSPARILPLDGAIGVVATSWSARECPVQFPTVLTCPARSSAVVAAFSAATGEALWAYEWATPPTALPPRQAPAGPGSAVIVAATSEGDALYILVRDGESVRGLQPMTLARLRARDGSVAWQLPLLEDATLMPHVLIAADDALLGLGWGTGLTVRAWHAASGAPLWASHHDLAPGQATSVFDHALAQDGRTLAVSGYVSTGELLPPNERGVANTRLDALVAALDVSAPAP